MFKAFDIKIFIREFLKFTAIFAVIQIVLTYFNSDLEDKWNPVNFIQNRMLSGFVGAFIIAIFRTIRDSGLRVDK